MKFVLLSDEQLIAEWTRPTKRDRKGNPTLKDCRHKDAVYAEIKRRNLEVPYVD